MRSMHAVIVSALAGLLFVSAAAAGCFEERHLSDVVGTGGQQSTGGSGGLSTSTGGQTASCTTECCKAEDCPAPAEPCQGPACNDGMCGSAPKVLGTSCSDAQNPIAKVCDGVAACVECNAVEECADKPICGQDKCACADHACILKECQNGQKDGSESDTDCGGDQCPKCADLKMCGKDADCLSDVCNNGICQVPTCNDGKKNGTETDKDCGGGMCPKCGPNLGCNADSDCVGDQCVSGQCAENCSDGVQNNGETSTDCGGPNCPGCIGDTCNVGADRVSSFCADQVCCNTSCDGFCEACTASLTGQPMDGICGAVQVGIADNGECGAASGTKAGGCGEVAGKCLCEDGIKNGQELGVDCGGPCSAGCPSGTPCTQGFECQSMECNSHCCAASGCGQCKACDAQGACGPLPAGSESTCFNISLCDGSGACKLKTGQGCASSANCLSNYCAGSPTKVCSTCANDSDCTLLGAAYGCRAGACRKVAGETCTLDIDCVSYNCVNSICGGCLGDLDCSSGKCASSRCLYENGMPCTINGNCASNSCGDPDSDGQKTCQP